MIENMDLQTVQHRRDSLIVGHMGLLLAGRKGLLPVVHMSFQPADRSDYLSGRNQTDYRSLRTAVVALLAVD